MKGKKRKKKPVLNNRHSHYIHLLSTSWQRLAAAPSPGFVTVCSPCRLTIAIPEKLHVLA